MKELQTRLSIIRDDNKQLDNLLIRGNAERHSHCNADHNTNIGEDIFWHTSRHYSWPKVSGTVIAKMSLVWDYSLPVGQRATNIINHK